MRALRPLTIALALAAAPAAADPGPALSPRLSLHEPTYFLPAYYTFSPARDVYANTLPGGQGLNQMEVKFQLSFKFALASGGVLRHVYAAYTQTSFWQLYRDSAFFRETNYQPEALIVPDERWALGRGWDLSVAASPYVHQSNGRGGSLERSWDRTSADAIFERADGDGGGGWKADLKAWIVWRDPAYRRYNDDLARYLGYGRQTFEYHRGPWELSVAFRNQLESGFRRGSVEADLRRAIGDYWDAYVQWFNGYGQSLIEYNRATNAVGAGFALRAR